MQPDLVSQGEPVKIGSGLAAGIAAAASVLVIALAAIGFIYLRRRKAHHSRNGRSASGDGGGSEEGDSGRGSSVGSGSSSQMAGGSSLRRRSGSVGGAAPVAGPTGAVAKGRRSKGMSSLVSAMNSAAMGIKALAHRGSATSLDAEADEVDIPGQVRSMLMLYCVCTARLAPDFVQPDLYSADATK